MICPVCGIPLAAKFTRGGQHYRAGVMLYCPDDSRHFRGFVNDPKWLRRADELGDPIPLIGFGVQEGEARSSELTPRRKEALGSEAA